MKLMYVMDANKPSGTAGRYPEFLARALCRVLNRYQPTTHRAFWDYAPTPEGY